MSSREELTCEVSYGLPGMGDHPIEQPRLGIPSKAAVLDSSVPVTFSLFLPNHQRGQFMKETKRDDPRPEYHREDLDET